MHGNWTTATPFVFANGLTTPSALNRDTPVQNYLGHRVNIVGLVFMSIAIGMTLLAALSVFALRGTAAIRQSQPTFLYILMFGCMLLASSIVTISFDENDGWSDEMLDRACLATPWLISVGYITIYCALFMKVRGGTFAPNSALF